MLMTIQARTYSVDILIPNGTASIASGIRINTGFQSQRMNMVCHPFQSVRKTFRMSLHRAVLITPTKKSIIYIDIIITCIFQTFLHHGIGLLLYQSLIDIHPIGIPRAPAHNRRIKYIFITGKSHGRHAQS